MNMPRRTYAGNYAHFCSVLQPSSIRGLATPWTYFLHLFLSSVILTDSSTGSPVHVLMLSIEAVRGLPCLRAPGIVPCIISFSTQLPRLLTYGKISTTLSKQHNFNAWRQMRVTHRWASTPAPAWGRQCCCIRVCSDRLQSRPLAPSTPLRLQQTQVR